jgi:hypothetical protein
MRISKALSSSGNTAEFKLYTIGKSHTHRCSYQVNPWTAVFRSPVYLRPRVRAYLRNGPKTIPSFGAVSIATQSTPYPTKCSSRVEMHQSYMSRLSVGTV